MFIFCLSVYWGLDRGVTELIFGALCLSRLQETLT